MPSTLSKIARHTAVSDLFSINRMDIIIATFNNFCSVSAFTRHLGVGRKVNIYRSYSNQNHSTQVSSQSVSANRAIARKAKIRFHCIQRKRRKMPMANHCGMISWKTQIGTPSLPPIQARFSGSKRLAT